jgi:hypothetical protein
MLAATECSAMDCARPMKPLPIKPNLIAASHCGCTRVTSGTTGPQAIAMESEFSITIEN